MPSIPQLLLAWSSITMETGSAEAGPPFTSVMFDSCLSPSHIGREAYQLPLNPDSYTAGLSSLSLLAPHQLLSLPLIWGDELKGCSWTGRTC